MAAEDTTLGLKRDRDGVRLPVTVLKQEGQKLSKLVGATSVTGRFRLSPVQSDEARDCLVDILCCLARLCDEMASLIESVTVESGGPDQKTTG